MELQEQSVAAGLTAPLKRLALLGVCTYGAAVLPSCARGSFRGFGSLDWARFPLFEAFSAGASLLYLPTMGFCIVCSAFDRSKPRIINLFAAIATFICYGIHDFGLDDAGTLVCLLIYALLVGPVAWLLFRRR